MSLPRLNFRRATWPVLMLLAAGCGSQEPIRSYTVTKPEVIDPSLASAAAVAEPQPQQILGAIVLLEDAGWFFKLTGDPAQVEPKRSDFLTFVKAVRFSAAGEPTWDVPGGWKELPGDQFRFATLQIPADPKPLELAVSLLPKKVADNEFVLVNVNRWRGQVGLDPTDQDELAKASETFPVDGHDTKFVSLVGESAGGGMGGAPFAPFASGAAAAPGSAPNVPARPKASSSAGDAGSLAFDTPEGWTTAQSNGLSHAAFLVADGEKKVEITVTPLALGSGTLLENVNRWRGQVKLERTNDAELAKSVKKVETFGTTGDYVELVGPGGTLLGVVATVGDQIWYAKLIGDPELAQRENARFQAFVKSLKLK